MVVAAATQTKPQTTAPAPASTQATAPFATPPKKGGRSNIPAREVALASEIKALRDAKKDASAKVSELQEFQFRRLCVRRVEQALNTLRTLKNLARMKPSEDYRKKVVATLHEAVTAVEISWQGTSETQTGFNL